MLKYVLGLLLVLGLSCNMVSADDSDTWNTFVNDAGGGTEIIDADDMNPMLEHMTGNWPPRDESTGFRSTAEALDLGTSIYRWRDLHLARTGSMEGLRVTGLATVETADINGGTADGLTSLTVANSVDIGSYGLRAANLTADGLSAAHVVFTGANGLLSIDNTFYYNDSTHSMDVQGLNLDTLTPLTGRAVTFGATAYDRLVLGDNGSAKGVLQNVDTSGLKLYYNAYLDGTGVHSYDSGQNAGYFNIDGGFSWYTGTAAATPIFTQRLTLSSLWLSTQNGVGINCDGNLNVVGNIDTPSIKAGGAEQLKFWSYVHTLTAQNITDTYANKTITAVTLNNVRAIYTCFRDVSNNDVLAEGFSKVTNADGWMARITSTTNVEIDWTTPTNHVAGDRVNIVIIEAQ